MGGTAVTGTRGLTVTGRTSLGCSLELSALSEAAQQHCVANRNQKVKMPLAMRNQVALLK